MAEQNNNFTFLPSLADNCDGLSETSNIGIPIITNNLFYRYLEVIIIKRVEMTTIKNKINIIMVK